MQKDIRPDRHVQAVQLTTTVFQIGIDLLGGQRLDTDRRRKLQALGKHSIFGKPAAYRDARSAFSFHEFIDRANAGRTAFSANLIQAIEQQNETAPFQPFARPAGRHEVFFRQLGLQPSRKAAVSFLPRR